MSNDTLILRLFLQLAVILATCYVAARIGRRLGIPDVICEIIAGILLGPSLFGLLWPNTQAALFPQKLVVGGTTIMHPSMSILYVLSHLALGFYMFLVGLEFDMSLLHGKAWQAATISVGGILVPFVLGALCSLILYPDATLFGRHQQVSPATAAVFLGASMSITAFPVLARMLQHYRIAHTGLGSLILLVAAANDVVAWCLLAVVLASLGHSPEAVVVTIVGGSLYAVGMLLLGRRGLRALERKAESQGHASNELIALALIVVLICGWLTTTIGIYEVFGAFVAGLAMPRGHLASALKGRLEGMITVLLLPIFFVYSGLNTRFTLLNTPKLWIYTVLIVIIAIAGKGVGCALSARAAHYSWRESATIGALMNTRGLIELIVLNVGLEAQIITPTLFTMLVFMAIVTTLMTSPLYQWLYQRNPGRERDRDVDQEVARIAPSTS